MHTTHIIKSTRVCSAPLASVCIPPILSSLQESAALHWLVCACRTYYPSLPVYTSHKRCHIASHNSLPMDNGHPLVSSVMKSHPSLKEPSQAGRRHRPGAVTGRAPSQAGRRHRPGAVTGRAPSQGGRRHRPGAVTGRAPSQAGRRHRPGAVTGRAPGGRGVEWLGAGGRRAGGTFRRLA